MREWVLGAENAGSTEGCMGIELSSASPGIHSQRSPNTLQSNTCRAARDKGVVFPWAGGKF